MLAAVADRPKLLVVDDEPDMLDFLARVFRQEYDVTLCSNAADALTALESEHYDVLVTDQKMPQMSGLELLERIGDRHPELVKVLLSGFTDVPEIERLVAELKLHCYVVKPIDSERLHEAVAEALARKRSP
jgi:adenylate cyclase